MFHYVYFLTDVATSAHHYVGKTSLKPSERLVYHNSGKVPHTAKYAFFRHKDFPYSVEDELKRQMEIEHREGLDFLISRHLPLGKQFPHLFQRWAICTISDGFRSVGGL